MTERGTAVPPVKSKKATRKMRVPRLRNAMALIFHAGLKTARGTESLFAFGIHYLNM